MRLLWALLGWLSLLLGLIGVVLPIMPTVPFMILAAFAFARSSERVHDWLLAHPQFGPSIRHWRERGAIGRRAKIYASVSFIASLCLGLALALPPIAMAFQALALAGSALFIWTRPDA